MPRVTDEYRSARREEILEAAMRAFHRRGFQSTSMADVITESGLSAGAIYGHFASKSDIILGVAERVIGARTDELEQLLAAERMLPPASLIRVLMTGMMRDLGAPAMIVQVWGEAISTPEIRSLAERVFAQLQSLYGRYIVAWLAQEYGTPPLEAEPIAREQVPLFLAAAQGFMLQSALIPGFDGDAYLTMIEKYLPR